MPERERTQSMTRPVEPDVAAEIRLRQCVEIARVSRWYIVFSLASMATVSLIERQAPHLLLFLLNVWMVGAGVFVWRATARERRAAPPPVSRLRASAYDLLWGFCGLSTGAVLLAISPMFAVKGQSVVDALVCGLIALGLIVAVRRTAACAYVLCIGALAAVRMIDLGGTGSVVLLGEFTLLILAAGCYADRTFRRHVTNEIMLQRQRELTALLLQEFEDGSEDWLWQTDNTSRLLHVDERVAAKTQTARALMGTRPLEWLRSVSSESEEQLLLMENATRNRQPFRQVVVDVAVGGQQRWLSLTGRPVVDRNGNHGGYRGVVSDVTAQILAERRIAHIAHHDSLTDLPNRTLFHETLDQFFARPDPAVALLLVDLDGFKPINDTYGHAAGDEVLVTIARRLQASLRDTEFVARLGGDEFAVLVPDMSHEQLSILAKRLVNTLSEPCRIEEAQIVVGASIGIALASSAIGSSKDLQRCADLALYRAKLEGRGTWRFFEPAMDEELRQRLSLHADLRAAIMSGGLELQFQPIIDLASSRVISCEALVRWQHPTRGRVMPGAFIGVAEDTGLIGPLGRWVLHRACTEAMRWPDGVGVTVNVSPIQFRDPLLIETLDGILASTGLPPRRLELEITETVLLEASARTLDCLRAIRQRGVRIALDDFGTGYSSLSYLRQFAFDTLKIDRSFVSDLRGDSSPAIVNAVIGIARSLDVSTVAEGVETEAQLAMLRDQGCSHVQGYLFSRPVSGDLLLSKFGEHWSCETALEAVEA
jgi:diguanylate cyclase (GGDEF)-like protein